MILTLLSQQLIQDHQDINTDYLAQKEPVMTCSQSLLDWPDLKPITQKTGAILLPVFLYQDQAKLRAIFKKYLYLQAFVWMAFETQLS